MTTPISSYSAFPCCFDGLRDIGQWVYDLAMKVFKAVQDFFCLPQSASEPAPIFQATVAPTAMDLFDFYRGTAPNNNGFTLDQILAWDDDSLESVHNYIQWLFPLMHPSGPNPTAPVLVPAMIHLFRGSAHLQEQVLRSFHRMLAFYGLQVDAGPRGTISRAPNFAARAAVWLTPNNHNFLRITRMIHSLKILGLTQQSVALFHIVCNIAANEGAGIVTQDNLRHWQNAVNPS